MEHCREQDVLVQDLIYNKQLDRAAQWYLRQVQSQAATCLVEIDRSDNNGQSEDVNEIAQRLIKEAKKDALAKQEAEIEEQKRKEEAEALRQRQELEQKEKER